MEPVPSNQSMENYIGEYALIGQNVNHFQSFYYISQPQWQSYQCHHTSVLIRQEDCVRFLTKERS